ncbi:L,D-transpeptidase family protein [Bacillus sp. V59.32b]|uniref:L,D-transpeptidase family protein n=1 Tax=Bacillus sp. V59.32b TaxID=1758642 RepID=UPI0020B128BC|nr:L,D-transpeptidase family protein [Bacillus sp. V59.32b]
MKKITGMAIIILFLLISIFNGKASAAVTQQSSCSKTSFQIQIKVSADLKEKPDAKAKTLKKLPANQKLGVIERKGGWYTVCYGAKTGYIAASQAKELYSSQENLMLSKFKTRLSVKQVLAVTANKPTDTKVTIKAYEFTYGEWRRTFKPMAGVVGKRGLSSNKVEGDGKAPMGIFSMGIGFGSQAKPAGMKWSYKKTTKYDYWIDDYRSKDYNKWVTSRKAPSVSHEKMNNPLYKYGAVINYNRYPVVKKKGSAIFLHVWRGPNSPTAGCIATDERNVVSILKWLNPDSKPHILISTTDHLKKIK